MSRIKTQTAEGHVCLSCTCQTKAVIHKISKTFSETKPSKPQGWAVNKNKQLML